MTRYAVVRGSSITEKTIERYLPSNYRTCGAFLGLDDGKYSILIAGEDDAGWTLDGYIIPRLASGLYWATELIEKP